MPNCGWFGAGDDHRGVIDSIFALGGIEIWEMVSQNGEPLGQFRDAHAIISRLERTGAAHLCLRVVAAGPAVRIERTELAQRATFFERAWGAGLIHLHLNDLRPPLAQGNTGQSSANHLAARGALGRAAHPLFRPEEWVFAVVTQFSAALNRQIRKGAVAKMGGLVWLPRAYEMWRNGLILANGASIATHPETVLSLP